MHGGEAVPLPLTDEYWYFRKSGERAGQPYSTCKLCISFVDTQRNGEAGGLVECKKVLKFVQELTLRCGSTEKAARYAGVGVSTLYKIYHYEQCTIQRDTARKLIMALDERRREDRRNGVVSQQLIDQRHKQAKREERIERLSGY